MKTLWTALLVPTIVVTIMLVPLQADEITNWNQTLFRAGLVGGTTPPVMTRVAVIVQAAVFDAVNGIDRRYSPIHVPPAGQCDERDAHPGSNYLRLVLELSLPKCSLEQRGTLAHRPRVAGIGY
jgi:hypothetical protein